ncbi:hypothetical protein T265_15832, partial [Opisthorchis viverrini]
QDLSALVSAGWHNGVGVEFCKDACKSQPNCFGFNWWMDGSACQLDDTAGSYAMWRSGYHLYEMKCCGKSTINICENTSCCSFNFCPMCIEFRAFK